jgi:hypothetical protein
MVYCLVNAFFSPQDPGVDKQIWLMTYGADCQSITHKMLSECGLEVDECYTVSWRESKYTLIHTQRCHRLRRTGMDKIMSKVQSLFQITGSGLFGFDSLSCNSRLDEAGAFSLVVHPGFRYMVQELKKSPSRIEWWMTQGDLKTNRKGMLWKYFDDTPPADMTREQLIKRVTAWGPIVKEHEQCKPQIETKPPPSTHSILTKYRTDKALRDVLKKVGKASKQLNCTPSPDSSGEIYAAVNPVTPHLFKMGFTFKDAETRVKALQTAGVLEPFELVRHAAVPDAR